MFEGWVEHFPGVAVEAVDLHAGPEVGRASMSDYADAVVAPAASLPRPLTLLGWSMGGLVALMAAERVRPRTLVVLEPSPPGEVQGFDPVVPLVEGTFDPEEVYGPFPAGIRSRPESSLARAERKRGISVATLPCPSLVVHGDEFPVDRGTAIASLYGSDVWHFPGLDHWGLVLDPRVPAAVAAHLDRIGY